MSDDGNDWMVNDEEEDEESQNQSKSAGRAPKPKKEEPVVEKTEAQLLIEARMKKNDEDDSERIREIEEARRIAREKEDEDLRKLKEKQSQRKKERELEDQKLEEQKRQLEERRKQEEDARKAKSEEDKRRKQEEAERKKAAAQAAMIGGRNFVIANKNEDNNVIDKFMNISKAKTEMALNTGELEDLKQRTLTDRVKPLALETLDFDGIKAKAEELWKLICQLETTKYDLEERNTRQTYDIKELNERQRQTNLKKHLAQGIDPNSASSRYPPKVQLISKYERRTDRRTFQERKGIFERDNMKSEVELVKPPAKKREEGSWVKGKKPRGEDDEEEEQEEDQENEQPQEQEEEEEEGTSIW